MKVEEIRELDRTELEARVRELKEEQFKLRFQASMMQIENPSIVRKIRRDIARINTILRERELAQKG
ncbi:MAG: 50S ribosomal protein L29 [Longimicrobiales bacterium]|nr:50S ribosomal protein L29 [Longimicrobiales bacterium]